MVAAGKGQMRYWVVIGKSQEGKKKRERSIREGHGVSKELMKRCVQGWQLNRLLKATKWLLKGRVK